eukprot:334310-Alexandrium_andersonii.AAC.1
MLEEARVHRLADAVALPHLLVHLDRAALLAAVNHLPKDVQHRCVKALDDPRREVVVLEDGVLAGQVKVRLHSVPCGRPILQAQGAPPH